MGEFVSYLQSAGPFTTPLCVFMMTVGGAAVKWLMNKIAALEQKLDESREETKGLLKQTIDDKTQAATQYAEFGEKMRTTMREYEARIERMQAVLEARSRA